MGSIFSKNNEEREPINQPPSYGDLEKRLQDLESLDRNNDGVVTKDEVELWLTEQKMYVDKLKDEIFEATEQKYQKKLDDAEKKYLKELNQTKQDIIKQTESKYLDYIIKSQQEK